jgi:membrane-associated phospholipid phosphatase
MKNAGPGRHAAGGCLSLFLASLLLLTPASALADSPAAPSPATPDATAESASIDTPCSDAAAEASEPSEPDVQNPNSLAGVGKIALKDTIYVLGSPVRWDGTQWLVVSGAAVGVVLVAAFADVAAHNATQSHQTQALDDLTRIVEPFGAEYSWAVLGAYAVVGLVFHDAEARDTAIDGIIASLLASGVITPAMKFAVGRARPNQDLGPTSFHPFHSGYTSFPSGHATQAFAVASVISAHSDKLWVSLSAYTLASLVAFARVYHNAHWTSDVTAGALIGTAVGQGVVALNKRLRSGESHVRIVFAPILGQRERGAGVTVLF